jgi:hypothetical protein
MALDFRTDRPNFQRNLPMPAQARESINERQERVAVSLHRLLALGSVGEDKNLSRLKNRVGTRVIFVVPIDAVSKRDHRGAGVFEQAPDGLTERT